MFMDRWCAPRSAHRLTQLDGITRSETDAGLGSWLRLLLVAQAFRPARQGESLAPRKSTSLAILAGEACPSHPADRDIADRDPFDLVDRVVAVAQPVPLRLLRLRAAGQYAEPRWDAAIIDTTRSWSSIS